MGTFLEKVIELWFAGGVLMLPLAVLCLMIFANGAQLWSYFNRRDYRQVDEGTWQNWIKFPDQARGEVGEIIRFSQDEVGSVSDIQSRFSEVMASKFPAVQRRLVFMNVLVAAAPLLGLLGTVLGMIHTFDAIATGGKDLTGAMASGISEALITTEVGLLIAIPGYFFAHIVKRKQHEYEAFLAKLESFTIQHVRMSRILPA